MRLDKYLAETAQCTRSEAKALLAKGRVQVNGAVCKKGDTQLKETDTVAVDGKALKARFMADAALPAPGATVWLEVVSPHTCYYRNEELMA